MPLNLLKQIGLTSDDAFTFLWRNIKVGVCLINEKREFLAVNPYFCHLLEYSESELLSKKFDDILLPLDLFHDIKMMEKLKTKQFEEYEMYQTYVTKTQNLTRLQLKVLPLSDKEGRLLFFFSQISSYDDEKYEMPPVPVQVKPPEMTWKSWLYEHGWKIIVAICTIIGILWKNAVDFEVMKRDYQKQQNTSIEHKSSDIIDNKTK